MAKRYNNLEYTDRSPKAKVDAVLGRWYSEYTEFEEV